MSDVRDQVITVLVTSEVKQKLIQTAKNENKPLSTLLYDILVILTSDTSEVKTSEVSINKPSEVKPTRDFAAEAEERFERTKRVERTKDVCPLCYSVILATDDWRYCSNTACSNNHPD